MKISILLLFVAVFSISATSYSQEARVTLDMENVSINEVFKGIQEQTNYSFWYDLKDINLDKIVSVCQSLRSLDPRALAYICCISNTSKEEYRCYHESLRNPTLWNTE